MCSLCMSLILNGVFTSQLASTFSKRMYYDDIDTLEQLEESGKNFALTRLLITIDMAGFTFQYSNSHIDLINSPSVPRLADPD